jgi:hypothetical protein
VAFHIDRRERVLERDIFRFGTATSVLLRGGALAGGARRGSGWFVELARKTGPARVQDLVGVVGREVVEPLAAVDAQPGAVLGADRGEGQGEDDGVPQQRLEVEDVALDPADLVLLARRLRGAARVGVQLLEVELQRVLEGLEAAGAGTGKGHLDVPAHEHALHDRLQAEPEGGLRAGRDADHLHAPVSGRRDGPLDLLHRSGTAAELSQVDPQGVACETPGVVRRGA